MGSCSSGSRSGDGFEGGGGGVNQNDIISERDMIVERGQNTDAVDEVLSVSQEMLNIYGQQVPLEQFLIAKMKPSASSMAYYDGSNIAVNEKYMNSKTMNSAYDACGKFHPSRGNKTGMQAVVAHEFGHALSDAVGRKLGGKGIDGASLEVMRRASKQLGAKNAGAVARKISGYAKTSAAEAVAEAFADVFCNGKNAKKESRTVIDICNGILGI